MPLASRPSAVWVLDDGLIMGGGQRFGLRLAEAFRELGIPVSFLSPADSAFGGEVRRRGFALVDVRYPRLVPPAVQAMPRAVTSLRRALERVDGDALVIGNTARCQAYATAALATLRTWPVLVHLMHEQNSAARPSARAVYRRIGALVAVGDETAELYRQHLPGVEVDAVSNFLDEPAVRTAIAHRTPPPGGPRPIVGMLGRLIPEKGVLELVDELAAIPDAWEQALVAAPPQDAAYTARVRARIAELGLGDRVRLLGEIHDVDRFFASIDALVVPSTGQEALPTVILEGLLHDRRVIVREHLHTAQFEGLPVQPYRTASDLAQRLSEPSGRPVGADEFLRRFGAAEVVDTILRVAAGAMGSGPRGYFEWHEEPGYFRDITDHFSPDDRMLDIGCGTAWLNAHFRDYVGIDISADAVAYAREAGRNAIVHDIAEPLPFEDASFDAVIAKDILEHVLDPVAVVQEIRRVLRPGGRVFASSPDAQRWVWDDYTHRRPYTLAGYRRMFADHGLQVARSGHESVMPGIGIVSGLTRGHHRPKALGALARLRWVRRNVWLVAERPTTP